MDLRNEATAAKLLPYYETLVEQCAEFASRTDIPGVMPHDLPDTDRDFALRMRGNEYAALLVRPDGQQARLIALLPPETERPAPPLVEALEAVIAPPASEWEKASMLLDEPRGIFIKSKHETPPPFQTLTIEGHENVERMKYMVAAGSGLVNTGELGGYGEEVMACLLRKLNAIKNQVGDDIRRGLTS